MDVHYGLLTLLIICSDDGYQELDFLNEAKNSVKCMDNFRRLSPHIAAYIYAPTVYWSLSTSKLLTMEFIEAPQVNDLKSIKKLGIRPHDISKLVSPFSFFVAVLFILTILQSLQFVFNDFYNKDNDFTRS